MNCVQLAGNRWFAYLHFVLNHLVKKKSLSETPLLYIAHVHTVLSIGCVLKCRSVKQKNLCFFSLVIHKQIKLATKELFLSYCCILN